MKNKIGVYICHCGSNISDYVDVEKVNEEVSRIEGVELSKTTMFACADATQQEMVRDIRERNLDSLVVASCSPKLHLFTFRNVAERAGLNPYNYVQVNIREQCSWAHSDRPSEATDKAIHLIKGGISRVKNAEALSPNVISADNVVIVVGAGIAGMRAAIELADMGSEVCLLEREYFVGGRASQWNTLFSTNETGREVVAKLYRKIREYDKITLFTGAEIVSSSGSVGNFTVDIRIKARHIRPDCKMDWEKFLAAVDVCPVEIDDPFNFGLTKQKAIYRNYPSEFPEIPAIHTDACTRCGECVKICEQIDLEQEDETVTIKAGAFVISTGFDPYEPQHGEYGFGQNDRVITLQQLKRLIELNDGELGYKESTVRDVAFIYCVGSRQQDGENKYCSRYCCTSAIHTSILLKQKYEGINTYHFNRGIRTYGKQEMLYKEASQNGDLFLQFFEDGPPAVEQENGRVTVRVHDFLTLGKEVEVAADLVVLVTGMVPRQDSAIGDILKIPVGRDKFFNEIHPKLRPVETVIDGIHICGACQGPKNITESVNSSLSAASKANTLVSKGEIELEPTLARIDPALCTGCDACTDGCPFDAISLVKENGQAVAEITEASCKGCGMCLPLCPENAIQLTGYTDHEMESMIEALIE
jgi:heterodisulfide reductase subunit A